MEEANRTAPAFARIFKEMILVAAPDKPLARTPKGTIMRKMCLKMYEGEIEGIYRAVDESQGNGIELPRAWNREGLREWLLENAFELLGRSNVDPTTDLFEQGADRCV